MRLNLKFVVTAAACLVVTAVGLGAAGNIARAQTGSGGPQAVPASPTGDFSSAKHPAWAKTPSKSDRLDLNTASEAQLAALPGVGGTVANAIIAHRPYTSKHQLVDRAVLSRKVYTRMKNFVVVKPE